MEYTAEIWFGNVVVKIELENYNGIGENSVLEVAKKVANKLGGECYCVAEKEK